MGGEIDDIDADTLLTSVSLQPIEVHFIWTFSNLCEHVWQNCKSCSPEVDLEPMEIARTLKSLGDDAFFVLNIPGEKDEHILNISCREVPYAIIAFYFVCFWEKYVHSSDDKGFSSHFSNCRYLG